MNFYTNADFRRIIGFAIDTARTAIADVDRFVIRLYGGWYENNSLTARASGLSAFIPDMNTMFPIIADKKMIQGNIELATQLYGHSFVWYNSYREHYGVKSLRVNTSALGDKCEANKNTCPVKILQKFTDKKMRICHNDGCNTVHSDVFYVRTQKYVDTMIACDIITLSSDPNVSGVYVMSDDVDHFPAFATAHDLLSTKTKIGLMLSSDSHVGDYTALLSPFEIEVSYIH